MPRMLIIFSKNKVYRNIIVFEGTSEDCWFKEGYNMQSPSLKEIEGIFR